MLIGLNSHKATGLDGMPARVIIDSANIICKPLCHIVYLSIQSGEFPCDIKKLKLLQFTRLAPMWQQSGILQLSWNCRIPCG